MKAWEAIKLVQEGNILESDNKQLLITGGQFLKLENKLDDSYISFPLMELQKDWQIKQEPIPFEKAIEYMRQGRLCINKNFRYKINELNELFYYNNQINQWVLSEKSCVSLLKSEWYLLPEEK